MSLRSGLVRLPGPAPGVWHGELPRDWLPYFTTMAWADLAAQVMALDGSGSDPAVLGPAAGTGRCGRSGSSGPPGRSAEGGPGGGAGGSGGGAWGSGGGSGGSGGGAGGGPPDDPVPAEDELGPIGTRLLVTNELVNIWEVELAPGELQPWHRHAHPYVVVVMEDSLGEITLPSGETRTPASGAGAVVFDPGGVVHKLRNIGVEVMRDRLIELKVPPSPDLTREIAR